jgi:hypothetical protein
VPLATTFRGLRNTLVDGPNSLGERARRRRWQTFMDTFPQFSGMSVLDLGGTPEYWLRLPVRPRAVHLINLSDPPAEHPPWMRFDLADACALPEGLLDDGYDLVYSNSVIEHVGGHLQREAFARQVHAAAPAHWVQTPYRYFPIEPHWVAPLMQFLPLRARAAMGMVWPLAHSRPSVLAESVAAQLSIELLDLTQMRYYFPGSQLICERVGGLVKSLIAVRVAQPAM